MNFKLNNITIENKFLIIFNKNNKKEYFHFNKILKLLNLLMDLKIKPTKRFIESLYYLNKKELDFLFNKIFKNNRIHGIALKNSFSTSNDLKEEKMTKEDFIIQIYMYYKVYGINEFPKELSKYIKNNKKINQEDDLKNIDLNNFKEIDYKTIKEFKNDLFKIVNLPIVFGETEKKYLKELYEYENDLILNILKESDLKIKENLIFFTTFLKIEDLKKLNLLKTSNDVLRYIYGGNFKNLRYKKSYEIFKISTSKKKFILNVLNNIIERTSINDFYEEFYSKKSHWKKVMINIHPFSKKYNKYKNIVNIFIKLYNNEKPKGFNYKKELYIKENEYIKLINLLSENTGLLLRHLDMLIRKTNDIEFDYLLEKFKKIENNLNVKLLIEVSCLLNYRSDYKNENIIYKLIDKSFQSNKSLEKLDKKRVLKIIDLFNLFIKNHLLNKKLFNKIPNKVFVNKELKNIILPSEIREVSKYKNKIQYTPGSRIKIKNDLKFLRFFTAWGTKKSGNHNFDIDLSGGFINQNNFSEIAYYNQTEDFAIHSGDFTYCHKWNRKKVVSEFIDIDIEKVKEKFDYFIINNGIYSSENLINDFYSDIKVVSGIININDRKKEVDSLINISNNFFEMELVGNGDNQIPFVFDLKTMEIILVDKYFNVGKYQNISFIRDKIEIYKREYFLAKYLKENIYEFLLNYLEANNIEIVENKEEADLIVDLNKEDLFENKDYFLINKENLYSLLSLLN